MYNETYANMLEYKNKAIKLTEALELLLSEAIVADEVQDEARAALIEFGVK